MFEASNITNAFSDVSKSDFNFLTSGKIRLVSPGVDLEEKDCFVGVTDEKILIAQPKLLGQNPGVKISFDKLLFDKIEFSKKEDKDKQNSMTAASYFAGNGPISTYSYEKLFIKLPYQANKGIKKITFTLSDAKEFLDILQERSPEGLLKDSGDEKEGDSPLDILKKRYAKGEISEEEYKKKKKLLED